MAKNKHHITTCMRFKKSVLICPKDTLFLSPKLRLLYHKLTEKWKYG
jgi:hypothetical protein